ncbi:MAG: DegT/DnrJ/EryC1/StrS family aminotransferase [Spirochaetes bacterium]|nr:DegT/DnrJ/EryC1/StrS family aminotransferase [Spirochaetota bacterium]
MTIPFFTNKYQEERYGDQILEIIKAICKKGVFIMGEEVKRFEQRMAAFTNCKHAIGVANGSDALFLALDAMHLPEGSEIITTPFTFFASTSCIIRNNHIPVFVDIDEKTYNIDVNKIETKITKKTKALLPVDLFSQTADIDGINNLAKAHGLKVLEDSAEAFGMKWNGRHAGCESDIGVLSFFPTKTLGCYGDGGMVISNNDSYAEEIRITRVHGASKKYHHTFVGINSRLDELQAGVLNIKLDHVEEEIKERAKIISLYCEQLKDIPTIALPAVSPNATPVWYVFSIQCDRRNELEAQLKANGIGTSVYYPRAMHEQPCFAWLGYKKGDFPIAEKLCESSLALPVFIGMTDEMITYICEKIRDFYKH